MGMTVALELLVAIYPIPTTLDDVRQDLLTLQSSGFLIAGDSNNTWTFAQVRLQSPASTARHKHAICHLHGVNLVQGQLTGINCSWNCEKAKISPWNLYMWESSRGINPPQTSTMNQSEHATRFPCNKVPIQQGYRNHPAGLKDLHLARCVQVLARDVAYDLIPFMQRRNLHARLAEVLSAALPISPVPATTIAYHWAHSSKASNNGDFDYAELPRILKVRSGRASL